MRGKTDVLKRKNADNKRIAKDFLMKSQTMACQKKCFCHPEFSFN